MCSTSGTRFMHSSSSRHLVSALCAALLLSPACGEAQTAATPARTPAQTAAQQQAPQTSGKAPSTGGIGGKDAPSGGQKTGTDSKSSSKPASAGEQAASTTKLKLGPLDPSVPPP